MEKQIRGFKYGKGDIVDCYLDLEEDFLLYTVFSSDGKQTCSYKLVLDNLGNVLERPTWIPTFGIFAGTKIKLLEKPGRFRPDLGMFIFPSYMKKIAFTLLWIHKYHKQKIYNCPKGVLHIIIKECDC